MEENVVDNTELIATALALFTSTSAAGMGLNSIRPGASGKFSCTEDSLKETRPNGDPKSASFMFTGKKAGFDASIYQVVGAWIMVEDPNSASADASATAENFNAFANDFNEEKPLTVDSLKRKAKFMPFKQWVFEHLEKDGANFMDVELTALGNVDDHNYNIDLSIEGDKKIGQKPQLYYWGEYEGSDEMRKSLSLIARDKYLDELNKLRPDVIKKGLKLDKDNQPSTSIIPLSRPVFSAKLAQ